MCLRFHFLGHMSYLLLRMLILTVSAFFFPFLTALVSLARGYWLFRLVLGSY